MNIATGSRFKGQAVSSIKATYDGQAFVPQQPLSLLPGTEVLVMIPSPRVASEVDNQQWQEILREIAASPPAFVDVDEALRQSRGRP